jgi:hypothetical protein
MPDRERPLVAAVAMGYGHLRPAAALARELAVPLVRCDEAPVADGEELRLWRRIRGTYEATTRWTSLPLVGNAVRAVVDWATHIEHLHPHRDQSRPGFAARRLAALVQAGLGRGVTGLLQAADRPLLTTHFAPAIAAAAAGCPEVWCVVTDSDVHRVWAPVDALHTTIHYLTPSMRAMRRLRAYGVPGPNVHFTGFPLPRQGSGDSAMEGLRQNFAARLVRLDPSHTLRAALRDELRHFLGDLPDDQEGAPPLLTFAVGGAGAQAGLVDQFLPGMARLIHAGRWRLALVAGVRREVADRFHAALARHGLDAAPPGAVTVLCAADHDSYFAGFDELLATTDVRSGSRSCWRHRSGCTRATTGVGRANTAPA